jgi:mono/diheme cytochrome c family protein
VLIAIPAIAHMLAARRVIRHPAVPLFEALAAVAVIAVLVQGYLGGRMTYDQAVGINDGGQLAQTAVGAEELNIALAQGKDEVLAGREAFSAEGLGCARCHGDRAQGMRGPRLAGGAELADFRRVHDHLLFPRRIVTDRDFAAIDAYLKTLGASRGGDTS